MKTARFQPSALALAIAMLATKPMAAEDFGPNATALTLRDIAPPSNSIIKGFDITPLPEATFAVTWTESVDNENRDRLLLQVFDSEGEPISEVLTLSATELNNSQLLGIPAIASDANGNLIIAWEVFNKPFQKLCAAHGSNIKAVGVTPPYDPANLVAVTLPVFPGLNPCAVDVVMDNDGDFALSWSNKVDDLFEHRVATYSGYVYNSGKTIAKDLGGPGALALNDQGMLAAAWLDKDAKPLGQYLSLQLGKVGEPFDFDNGITSDDGTTIVQAGVSPDAETGFVFYWSQEKKAGVEVIAKTTHLQRWHEDRSPGTDFQIGAFIDPGSTDAGIPSVESDQQGNLVTTWDGNGAEVSPKFATAIDSDSELVVESFAFDIPTQRLKQSARVAMSNDLIALAWLDEGAKQLTAKVYAPLFQEPEPGLDPVIIDQPDSTSSGGTIGFLAGLLVLLLAPARLLGRRAKMID